MSTQQKRDSQHSRQFQPQRGGGGGTGGGGDRRQTGPVAMASRPSGAVQIDGALGEGGGQIIRSSLALSLVSGLPFEVRNVRANRTPGGLRPQHLAAVEAAAAIGNATVEGAAVGSTAFSFVPGRVQAGHYEFDIGTAGSSTLVLQTVLLPLLLTEEPSTLVIEGGTHNAHAPPVEFIADTFLPQIERIGGHVRLTVEQYGSYPRGGGRIDVEIDPIRNPRPLRLDQPVTPRVQRARALAIALPDSIAERELAVVQHAFSLEPSQLEIVRSDDAVGATNAVIVSVAAGEVVETVSAIGQRGVPAEQVAQAAVAEVDQFVSRGVPVGEHLADQLLLPMAVAAGGAFLTGPLTLHAATNMNTIRSFVHAEIEAVDRGDGTTIVRVAAPDHRVTPGDRHIGIDDIRACGHLDRSLETMALDGAQRAAANRGRNLALADLVQVLSRPERNSSHPEYGELARALDQQPVARACSLPVRSSPVSWASWCEQLDEGTAEQMRDAMRLPSAVRGALMPDAHRGYGLPIGGVLATRGTVVPYAVGVDIACRMKLTVLDSGVELLDRDRDRMLEKALLQRTRFGSGSELGVRDRRDHAVLDMSRWQALPITARLRDRAWAQLGTSGSGNHFVEFGQLTLEEPALGIEPGRYLALLSHSGSRGPGARVATWFTERAKALHPELPDELRNLAWLELDSDDGRDYWTAMQLMGEYAAACHEVIHERVVDYLGAGAMTTVENHHNFAWMERHDGEELLVHRKGATPAGDGVLGIIPGSMASPAFVVRGKGQPASLCSASHGAGRIMSRSAARQQFSWQQVTPLLRQARVKLLSAGIDESPLVYKDIHKVMAEQRDLVDVIARFDPRVVRMANG